MATTTVSSRRASVLPGLGLCAGAVLLATLLAGVVGALSPLVVAVLLGAVVVNTKLLPASAVPGTDFAAKHLLRAGVVLLGFRLVLADVLRLGGPGFVMVVTVVAITFFGTQWLGRRLGLSPELSLLTATGFSICGASAVAAMDSVVDADEEEVAFSIGLVTLCGTLAMVTLPLLAVPLGLAGTAFGQWVGASVHDVAQVVATAAVEGQVALEAAVVVKLTRIVLLAPLVAGVGAVRRHRTGGGASTGAPLVPLFVIGFLVAAAIRSVGLVPAGWLDPIARVESLLFTAALFGLGTGVRIDRLRRIGGRPLVLGLSSWFLVAAIAFGGVTVIGAW